MTANTELIAWGRPMATDRNSYSAPMFACPVISGLNGDGIVYTLPDVEGPVLVLFVKANGWKIDKIEVPPELRGRGFGRQLLAAVCDAADGEGVTITLTVERYSRSGLYKQALRTWYGRMGFIPMGDDHMEREPRTAP